MYFKYTLGVLSLINIDQMFYNRALNWLKETYSVLMAAKTTSLLSELILFNKNHWFSVFGVPNHTDLKFAAPRAS